jgi:uncharacterized membrane protein (UPF0127 family)
MLRYYLILCSIIFQVLFLRPVVFAESLEAVKEFTSGEEAAILIGNIPATVELAVTLDHKQQGLMYRESLETDHGMLFVLDSERTCFWMKNTYIDLDLAFIDRDGRITEIYPLEAENLERVCSIEPASYALEMESGWFAKRNVGEGALVEIVD